MLDVQEITSRAEKKLLENDSNPEESRQIYLEEIMDWSDNYTENMLNKSASKEAKDALSSIVQLWIAFCTMEINLRQFKRAVKIFEDALSDPVASRSADIYLAYVDYCKTRGKLSNAQKVYIKGISSALPQEDADKLWANFLPFIQSQGSPDLSMNQLYEAVRSEAGVGADSLSPPGPGATAGPGGESESIPTPSTHIESSTPIHIDSSQDSNINNRSQTLVEVDSSSPMILEESYVVAESKSDDTTNSSSFIASSSNGSLEKPQIVKSEESVDKMIVVEEEKIVIKCEANKTDGLENKHEIIASSVVRDAINNPGGIGDDLDSVTGMTPEQLIRIYRHRPPMLFSAPFKEPTVSGLSSLSPEEVLELEKFLGVSLSSIQYGERQTPADAYLDLVEGLWTAQALKERHFDSWFTDLKRLHEKEGRELGKLCEEKEASAATLIDSVKEKNQVDRKRFQSRCEVQREVLHSVVNKVIYSLLMDQQRTLVAAGFPHFSSGTVERIQTVMAALRSGEQPETKFDGPLLEELSIQKKLMCALLSLRVNLAPPPDPRSGRTGSRERATGSENGNKGGISGAKGSSMGNDYHDNRGNNFSGQNHGPDYFSQDAKLQRKAKRRKVYPDGGGDEIRFDDHRVRSDYGASSSRAFDARRKGPGYQGPEHLRRGPKRIEQRSNRDIGPQQTNLSQNYQNAPVNTTIAENKPEEAPLSLLQKLANMLQKAKK